MTRKRKERSLVNLKQKKQKILKRFVDFLSFDSFNTVRRCQFKTFSKYECLEIFVLRLMKCNSHDKLLLQVYDQLSSDYMILVEVTLNV